MSFDINITVNGNRCKQYHHQGKTFIQANPGSEYVIEIKNNQYKRVLAVGSVDGLNVLTGKTASESDSGYIVGSYSSEKIKGFRFSDDEWALFKFGYKMNGNTYAQSKEDGSEKNCGVIGMRLFYEKEIASQITWINMTPNYNNPHYNGYGWGGSTGTIPNVSFYNCCDSNLKYGTAQNYSCGLPTRSAKTYKNSCEDSSTTLDFCSSTSQDIKGFDVGTEFGRKETSKIRNVEFERGVLAKSFDIYYASRESLIQMGIPLENKLQVNLPQSFPNKYCELPKGYVG